MSEAYDIIIVGSGAGAQANALRVGDHLLERLGARPAAVPASAATS